MPMTQTFDENLEKKPYNRCIECIHIGKTCDGPNFLAMTTERWCEWCNLRAEYLDWTHAYIAKVAKVSKVSVDRVMAGNVKDLRISTMQNITRALVNGSWGQYPCSLSEIANADVVYIDNPSLRERAENAEKECERLQSMLNSVTAEHNHDVEVVHDDQQKISFLKSQVEFKEEQMKAKDRLIQERYDFLKRKDRVIFVLAICLAICLVLIIGALVADKLNPDIGFFWLRSWFGGGSSLNTKLLGIT